MPVRSAVLALALALAGILAAAPSCPRSSPPDTADCNAAHSTRITIAACAADAQATETCGDRAPGTERALYLTRAASEWRRAAIATGSHTAQARRWLAHAMVLDERVQDDPDAPLDVRKRAKHDERLARGALNRR